MHMRWSCYHGFAVTRVLAVKAANVDFVGFLIVLQVTAVANTCVIGV